MVGLASAENPLQQPSFLLPPRPSHKSLDDAQKARSKESPSVLDASCGHTADAET
jgi:hypothetical protein